MTLAQPGFADPVHDSQACFRAVLDAMARPGTIHRVAAPTNPPPPLHRATAAALLTLADADTPIWLDDAAAAAEEWIAFHCGAPRLAQPRPAPPRPAQPRPAQPRPAQPRTPQAHATFALALSPVPLAAFHPGSDDAPEEGATLVLQLAALGAGRTFRLAGPGLAAPALFRVDGLPPGFAAEWQANHALYPRGIDLLLCAGDEIAAFPRTLTIQEA